MANHKKPDDIKVVSLCGSVLKNTKATVLRLAEKEGITPAMMVGRIVEEWIEDRGILKVQETDPNQGRLPGVEG